MEDQPKKITGYRDLNENDITRINASKAMAEKAGDFIKQLEQLEEIDKRWLALAKTDLQKGFMSLVRSIAKPESF